jgi:hypothetical protein
MEAAAEAAARDILPAGLDIPADTRTKICDEKWDSASRNGPVSHFFVRGLPAAQGAETYLGDVTDRCCRGEKDGGNRGAS